MNTLAMMKVKVSALLAIAMLGGGIASVYAQDSGGEVENIPLNQLLYDKNILDRLKVSYELQPHDQGLMGDKIDKKTGLLQFEHVDVSLPGNSALPVEIRRVFSYREESKGELAGWELDVPKISYALPDWKAIPLTGQINIIIGGGRPEGYNDEIQQQCSGDIKAQSLSFSGGDYLAIAWGRNYTSGPQLMIPGQGKQGFMWNRDRLSGAASSDYRFVTKNKWRISCIAQAGGTGEGFVAESPQGIKYTFDTLIKSRKPNGDIEADGYYFGYLTNFDFVATKVEDRFGNWVKYNYIDGKLTRIHSNDGRTIDIDYDPSNHDFIDSVSVGERVWRYEYQDTPWPPGSSTFFSTRLTDVILPSGSSWQFNINKTPEPAYDYKEPWQRLKDGLPPGTSYVRVLEPAYEITHPDGTKGSFIVGQVEHCDTGVHPDPMASRPFGHLDMIMARACPYFYSLVSKTLSGPGMAPQTWTYDYSENAGNYHAFNGNNDIVYDTDGTVMLGGVNRGRDNIDEFQLTGTLPSNIDNYHYRSSIITQPDGSYAKYFINRNRLSNKYDLIIAEQYFSGADQLLKEVKHEHSDGTKFGDSFFMPVEMAHIHNQTRKLIKVGTQSFYGVGSDVFTKEYQSFDQYDVPQITYLHNNVDLAKKRYIKRDYIHDTANWLLNLPTTLSLSTNGVNYSEVSKTSYHGATSNYKSLPNCSYSYTQLFSCNESYHLNTTDQNGLLKKVTFNQDGYWREFGNYKRGQPQQISQPTAGSSTVSQLMHLTIDDNGWVKQTEDFEGNTTDYDYDLLGRLTDIIPQDTQWAPTTITYQTISSNEGFSVLAPGMLRQTVIRGNYQKDNYLDSRLRSLLTVEQDITDNNSIRYQLNRFDALNKPTFTSYPSTSPVESSGTHYLYDGLQRLKRTNVDSELGQLSSITEYLDGNRIKTTDFNGNETTTTYLAYGSPQYKQALNIESPESVTTSMVYNLFDRLTSITQGGITQSNVYDSYQQLCKEVRPDIGNKAYHYNAIGQLTWSAHGSSIDSSTTGCDIAVAVQDKTSYQYDYNGNTDLIIYGDGTASRDYSYDKNGNVKTISATGYSQSYNYNSANLLDDETLVVNGKTFTLDYGYDALGNLSQLTYPDGLAPVSYAPNALGQPTQAIRQYANYSTDVFVNAGVSYYPNGMVNHFTYGNGATHTTTLNSRQIPEQLHDQFYNNDQLHFSYTYDANSNIKSITNPRDGGIYSLSNLTYDGLDRLKTTTGGTGIGSSALTYDELGNIKTYSNTSAFKPSDLTYSYNNNRLSGVSGPGSTGYNFNSSDSYDSRGNVTNNGKRSFTYNLANQMTGSGSNSYIYDGHNRRVMTQDSKGTSYSMYSQSGRLLYRETSAGAVNYIFLGGKLVAKEGAGVTSQNSIMNYKPFGDSVEAAKDEVGYTGHKFDTDLGLSYMQARYYDPVIGRFYSNDPVDALTFIQKGNVQGFNRYAYANNNPYKYTDPNGESPTIAAGAGAGCAATGPGCPVGAVVGGLIGAIIGVAIADAAINHFNESSEGTRTLGDLETIHDSDHAQNDPAIGELNDNDLADALTNPSEGDKVTVKGNKVYDGNTRVNEAKSRGFDGGMEIPVDELPNPPIDIDNDPLGGY